MKKIPQIEPLIESSEIEAVTQYLKSGGWLTEFKKTEEFAKEIKNLTKSEYCSITTSGTTALFLALKAFNIGKGNEVIIPNFTMVATANAINLASAEIVFADIEKESLCINLENIKKSVTPKTKAIILVSINGRYPSDIKNIVNFCKEKKIIIIEDSAQSLGSFYKNKHIGTYGDIGIFSFSMPKIITTGQGGALITNNKEIIERINKLKDFGRKESGADNYITMGWNFKFTDLQATIGLEQIKKIDWKIKRKKEIYNLYKENLKDLKEIEFIKTNTNETTPWFIDILVKNNKKESLISYLKEKGIGSRAFYPPLNKEPVFNTGESFPISEIISKEGLWLPSSLQLSKEDINYVCDIIRDFFKEKNQKIHNKISIVTPVYNGEKFIEESIKSVLSQEGNFEIEYIIVDGKSEDNTVDIIKKYDNLLKNNEFPVKCNKINFIWWSEKDGGQTQAMNKGLKRATGEILAVLDGDDFYEPGAFQEIIDIFNKNPKLDIVYGDGYNLYENTGNKKITKGETTNFELLLKRGNCIFEPSTFFTKRITQKIGLFDEEFQYAMDYEYWLRILKVSQGLYIPKPLATFRKWEMSKTMTQNKKFMNDRKKIFKKYKGNIVDPKYIYSFRQKIPGITIIQNKFPKLYSQIKKLSYFFIDKLHY